MKKDLQSGAPDLKGAQGYQKQQKAERLKTAAVLSHSETAENIMSAVDISKRTLQRYLQDPLWRVYDGNPDLTFPKGESGRPKKATLSEEESEMLTEANRLHSLENTWVQVANILKIPFSRLRTLRKRAQLDTSIHPSDLEREMLRQAYQLREQKEKWGDIAEKIGINRNRLDYLRKKYGRQTEI